VDSSQSAVKRRRPAANSEPGPSLLASDPAALVPSVPTSASSAPRCQADQPAGSGDAPETSLASVSPTRCPECFMDPCVITRPHNFLGPGRRACADNAASRRTKYKKYWNMLKYLGAWGNLEYLERRRQAVAMDPAARGNNPREIMPMCVVRHVRSHYPNQPGVPYMGHVWL